MEMIPLLEEGFKEKKLVSLKKKKKKANMGR
jgi:hypothetical protein